MYPIDLFSSCSILKFRNPDIPKSEAIKIVEQNFRNWDPVHSLQQTWCSNDESFRISDINDAFLSLFLIHTELGNPYSECLFKWSIRQHNIVISYITLKFQFKSNSSTGIGKDTSASCFYQKFEKSKNWDPQTRWYNRVADFSCRLQSCPVRNDTDLLAFSLTFHVSPPLPSFLLGDMCNVFFVLR